MKDQEIDRLEAIVGRVLRIGSIASASILAVGLLLTLAVPSFAPAQTITRFGLFVLLLTPVSRVVASVVEYSRDRDWLFTALTFVVLAIVIGSLLVGALTEARGKAEALPYRTRDPCRRRANSSHAPRRRSSCTSGNVESTCSNCAGVSSYILATNA